MVVLKKKWKLWNKISIIPRKIKNLKQNLIILTKIEKFEPYENFVKNIKLNMIILKKKEKN